jgi:fucose permease
VFIFATLPVWKKGVLGDDNSAHEETEQSKPLSFKEIFSIKGAVACFFAFFCYCALELTTSLWASSFLVEQWKFSPDVAAGYASLFYLGITSGRFINGFLAMKLSDRFLIRAGSGIVTLGIIFLFLPFHSLFSLIGFIVIGLGCAPIYPCIIHMTPDVFGKDKSQAMIGVQMAFAYIGFLVMPPLFGVIAEKISIMLLPLFLSILLVAMVLMHEIVVNKNKKD